MDRSPAITAAIVVWGKAQAASELLNHSPTCGGWKLRLLAVPLNRFVRMNTGIVSNSQLLQYFINAK